MTPEQVIEFAKGDGPHHAATWIKMSWANWSNEERLECMQLLSELHLGGATWCALTLLLDIDKARRELEGDDE